ncbi:MAG TPA: response regulator [Bryobacteraceae bacterium]|nr:response regulator [Bryobacteraceae bacterium]
MIDDDPVDREILRYRLFESGSEFEYQTAESGRKGLELLRSWKPDCVLLDLNLPDLERLDLLRGALAQSTAAPIIVITAHGSEQIAAEAMRNGAAGYLIKGSLNGNARTRSTVFWNGRLCAAKLKSSGCTSSSGTGNWKRS